MKYAKVVCLLFLGTHVCEVMAHTSTESNQVVSAALDYVLMYGHRPWKSSRRVYDSSADPNTWQTFLRFGWESWTIDERRAAFDQYLAGLGSANLKDATEREKMRVCAAIGRCRVLNHTNAAPTLIALALNPNGVHRDKAIELALDFLPVDDSATAFAEAVITNVQSYSAGERLECIWRFSDRLRPLDCATGTAERAVAMFYRNRKKERTGALTIDRLLVEKIDGYAASSNRLDTALFMLDAVNARPGFVEYFVDVTNQLLSSGQPLVQLNIGEGGDE